MGGDDPEWYLGTFTPYQPDFDHRHPAVDAMFADVLRFWFDHGVDGFRVDAVWPIGKHPDLPDCPPLAPGEFVSSGTLTEAQLIAAGDTYTAIVEGFNLPPLTVRVLGA